MQTVSAADHVSRQVALAQYVASVAAQAACCAGCGVGCAGCGVGCVETATSRSSLPPDRAEHGTAAGGRARGRLPVWVTCAESCLGS
jgi:hypothetical protein